ncbi:MAG: molybdopterin-dependent oxidoreductase [Janthinobacterium lividum]
MPRPDAAARTAATLALALLLAMPAARARAPEAAPMDMAPAGPAANSTTLAITGRVARPSTLDIDALRAMPSATVALDAAPGHGERHATYTGVPVWTLLDAAGLLDEPGRKTFLQHTVLAHGQDGYAVALAIGELDPRFEGKQALVAYAEDDHPLPSLRLVLPGDRRAGRSVHDLAGLEVR